MNRIAWATAALLMGGFSRAQAPVRFEVASVKPNLLNDHIVTIAVGPGDRFAARGYTLVLLMQRAYGLMDWNVTGGPAWIRSDRFDVVAKAGTPGNLTERELQPRLQALLAERFKLQVHETTREMPGYALVVAKGGPRLTRSLETEERGDSFRMSGSAITAQAIAMNELARYVAGKLGLVGVDETGLPGLYDLDVKWRVEADPLPGADPREALREAVFRALQEQLGLKMEHKRIAVRTLVIDHAEKASAAEN